MFGTMVCNMTCNVLCEGVILIGRVKLTCEEGKRRERILDYFFL